MSIDRNLKKLIDSSLSSLRLTLLYKLDIVIKIRINHRNSLKPNLNEAKTYDTAYETNMYIMIFLFMCLKLNTKKDLRFTTLFNTIIKRITNEH